VALGIVCVWIAGAPATAQDNVEDRVAALETQVATISAGDRVAEFSGPAPESPSIATPYLGSPLTISGVGSTVTDDFRLPTGRYIVTVEWESGAIVVDLWSSRTTPTAIAYGLSSDSGRLETVFVADATVVGGVFLEVSNTSGQWRITFAPR